MRILYVILTCEKYLDTRCTLIKSTWLNQLDENDDYVFLSSRPILEKNIIGFYTPDDYKSVPLKYLKFFREAPDSYFDFDWVYFCDDDTFVFPKRLKNLLAQYDSKVLVCIGRKGIFVRPVWKLGRWILRREKIEFPSGGAGFAVSKPAIVALREYLRRINYDYRRFTFGDVTFGYWFKQTNIPIIDRCDVLKAQNPRHPENRDLDINNVVSYHYCDEQDFTQLYSIARSDLGMES